MVRFLSAAIGFLFVVGTVSISSVAVGAILGFSYPILDFVNHLQPLLFVGTLFCLLFAPLFLRGNLWRAFAMAIAATGFLGSAIAIVPEFTSSLAERPAAPTNGQPVYRMLSHNVFGLNYDARRVAEAIYAEDPDIIALQEYFPEQRLELHGLLIANYPHHAICMGGKRANIAIYSKIEFEAETQGACAPGSPVVTDPMDESGERVSRIIANFSGRDDVPFTIVTTHLDWPTQVSKLTQGATLSEGFDLAFGRQKDQFDDLGEALTKVPGPVILAADLNSTAWSYALGDFAAYTGFTRETRHMLTYPARFYVFGWRDTFAFLPLDHVMTRGGVEVHNLHGGDPAGSDHRSVITEFSINAPVG